MSVRIFDMHYTKKINELHRSFYFYLLKCFCIFLVYVKGKKRMFSVSE